MQKPNINFRLPLIDKSLGGQKLCISFLAGLIDGDGHIVIRKTTGEIRLVGHSNDLPLFSQLQNQLGGEVRKEAKKSAIRFFLNIKNTKGGRAGFLEFVTSLNGHIRNTIRVEQFKKLCDVFQITFLVAPPLTNQDGYCAGLFAADGSIFMRASYSAATKKANKEADKLNHNSWSSISQRSCPRTIADWVPPTVESSLKEKKLQKFIKGVSPGISVRIANKYLANIENLKLAFGFGECIFDSRGWHSFFFYHKSDILLFTEYMQKYRCLSIKYKRLDLVETFYDLAAKKAYFPNASPELLKRWECLVRNWFEE